MAEFYPNQTDYIEKLEALWTRVTEQLSGTSTTSLTVGTGAKSLTTQASKQFAVGQSVRITRTSDITKWMQGIVTGYNATTGGLDVLVDTTSGAGTFTDWTVSLTGGSGPAGSPGADGADGAAATISVGTVTTGAAGSSVIVTNSGTSSAAVFDFTIPRGDPGLGNGDVVGPASSVDNEVALFSGTTGKLLKRATGSGLAVLTSGVLSVIANSTDNITEGATNLYHTAARVRSTVLTGLSTALGTTVTAAHTVLEAIGFLQKQATDNASSISTHTANTSNPHSVTKSQVGLSNVDNTSDADKPISTATQTALNAKEPTISAGTTAQFWRGDKSWVDFGSTVRATVLTGLSTAAGTVVTATHTILEAIGFLQKQVSDNTTAIAGKQATLVSGTNIKTVNGNSLLGSGDISVSADVAAAIVGATDKATPVDADSFGLVDSAASNVLKELTWANVKATLKTYFDSLTTTLTNKRITARVDTVASSATPTINTDNVDVFRITAQAEAITSMTTNLSGSPTDSQALIIEITGTAARAITWGASFEASTVALPTTTVTTNKLTVGFLYNSVTSKWRCVAAV